MTAYYIEFKDPRETHWRKHETIRFGTREEAEERRKTYKEGETRIAESWRQPSYFWLIHIAADGAETGYLMSIRDRKAYPGIKSGIRIHRT